MAKLTHEVIRIQIGSSDGVAFVHTLDRSLIHEVARNGARVAIKTTKIALPGRKPAIWTFVFLHSSEAAAAQTETILSRGISPGISLRVDGRITGILASNEESIQSEGFSGRSIRALARQLNLSATRVSAPKHKTALHLLHREGISLLELPNK